jgi:hypothetical protein
VRRLTQHHRDDYGVGTIFFVLAMVALLVAAGFAIDITRYAFENSSAQHSADATALAMATDCALTGSPIADYSPYRKDNQSINPPDCGGGEVHVIVTKPMTGQIFIKRDDTPDVERDAKAKWGTLGTATTVPITISECEFSQALLDGTTDITLYLDDTKPQSGCSSLPGGFSQLLDDNCAVTVSSGSTAEGDPGADAQKLVPCVTNPTPPALPHDVLIPMYDSEACQADLLNCKGNGEYPIIGFAAFRITGYSFNGNAYGGSLPKNCPDKDRGKYCINGDFIKFVTSLGSPGPSTDFGTHNVYLSA